MEQNHNIVANGKTVCTIHSNPTDGLTMAAKLKANEKIGYLAGNVAQKLYNSIIRDERGNILYGNDGLMKRELSADEAEEFKNTTKKFLTYIHSGHIKVDYDSLASLVNLNDDSIPHNIQIEQCQTFRKAINAAVETANKVTSKDMSNGR